MARSMKGPVDAPIRINRGGGIESAHHDGHGVGAGVEEPVCGGGRHDAVLPGQGHGDGAPAVGRAQAHVRREGGQEHRPTIRERLGRDRRLRTKVLGRKALGLGGRSNIIFSSFGSIAGEEVTVGSR